MDTSKELDIASLLTDFERTTDEHEWFRANIIAGVRNRWRVNSEAWKSIQGRCFKAS